MKLPVLGAILATAAACAAPRAQPISGDIASVLERGIADGTESFDHSAWDELLIAHARSEGRQFDYAGLKRDEDKFETYLASLADAELSALTAAEIQVFFINAYNAYTIRSILDHVAEDGSYAIESIRDIPDVFQRTVHDVGGYELSLDNMEHNVLRPLFKDPRVHFAVNCASTSCPPLPVRAFAAATADAQLDAVTKATLRNPDYISVEDDALLVTRIMDWYGGDFVNPDFDGSESSLAAYIAKYAHDDVRAFIDGIERQGDAVSVVFRDYDWALNRP